MNSTFRVTCKWFNICWNLLWCCSEYKQSCIMLQGNYLLCWSRSSSGTLKEKRLLLFMLRTICFLLLSDVSGTTSSSPSGRWQQKVQQTCLHDGLQSAANSHCWLRMAHQTSSCYSGCFVLQNIFVERTVEGYETQELKSCRWRARHSAAALHAAV